MLRGSFIIQPLNSFPTAAPTLNPALANSSSNVHEESLLYKRRYIWAPIVGVLLGMVFLYVAGWAVYVTLRRLHIIRHPRPTNFEPFKEPKPHQNSRRIRRALTGAMDKSRSWGFVSSTSFSANDTGSKETKMKGASKQRGKPRQSPTKQVESKESSPSNFASRGMRLLMPSPKTKQRKHPHKRRGRYRGRTTSEHNMRMKELNEMARVGRSSSHDSHDNDDDLDHSSESEHDAYSDSDGDNDSSLEGTLANAPGKISREFGGENIVATHSLRESDLYRSINASKSREVEVGGDRGGTVDGCPPLNERKSGSARLSSRRFMSESSSSSISIKLSEGDFTDDEVVLCRGEGPAMSSSGKAQSEEAVLEWNTIYSNEDTVVDKILPSKRPSTAAASIEMATPATAILRGYKV